jgi:error-prone DNA polymerase
VTRSEFAHLHVASWYSFRYGVCGPAALAARAAELGMPALALTDRDGLYGAVKHAVACAAHRIAPVLGADLALREAREGREPAAGREAPGGHFPRGPARLRSASAARVTLLAEGKPGWGSLCRLVSAAHRAGERGAPVVTPDLVGAHARGLVVLLGPDSDVGRAVAARRPDLATRALGRWREHAEVVVEITDHEEAGTTSRAGRMLGFARAMGVPAVLTNAVRYLDRADAPLAQVLDAARHLVPLGREHRAPARAHLATGAEMAAAADRIAARSGAAHRGAAAAELLAATASLAKRCSLDPGRDLGIGGRFLPETAGDPLARLRAACEAGLRRRFPPGRVSRPGRAAARERLERELAIIATTGLASYFLVVADVAGLIARRGIRCSIRGSGAGCLVNYLLGISAINPLEHGLIMERFLSERRRGLPDIDLDVESARRTEAYRAIVDAYSEQRVACVSMLETYRARSALREVAAALALPPPEADALARAFPRIRAAHIRGALAELPELRASGLAIPQLSQVFRLAERLDGLPRHIAMHPCGIVLSDTTLLDRTPVEPSLEGFPLSQFDSGDVEAAGMIKLDVLGVRMQSAMVHALAEIERATGTRVDIDAVPLDDEPTFEMIRSGHTLGCFQIESPGQRELVGKLLPRDIGDLIVDISLFRPGPVNSDMVTSYLEIRHGRRPPCYPDESLAGALAETGGVVVFHEQVLRVLDVMTGCGLSHAELIRRALSEERYREQVADWFRARARERGYRATVVDRVWEVLAAFGAFGFCKAHAAAFAIPTYQSAWLKRHYPAAFYAGVLTHDPGMYPKRVIAGDARLRGIEILPVDINASTGGWRAERAGQPPRDALRPGLSEVKGISAREVAGIVAGQPYASLRDFWERAGVSRPVAERLILVGAFDRLYELAAGGCPERAAGGCPERAAGGCPELAAGGCPERAAGGPPGEDRQEGPVPVSRRDLLARLGVLARSARRPHDCCHFPGNRFPKAHHSRSAGRGDLALAGRAGLQSPARAYPGRPDPLFELGGDGFAGLVPAGQLRDLDPAERVAAELEILGIDLSQHVLSFYEDVMSELGVVRSAVLHRCPPGAQVLVAGVKVATQTPAVRSGQRIIFATLDDATGPVDLVFFESAQERCAARVFGSWLLVVRGRVRRVGRSVSVSGAECWDLAALARIRAVSGPGAVRAAMAAGAVRDLIPGLPDIPGKPPKIIYPNGFTQSPYAEASAPGGNMRNPSRLLWHASPGSSGGWQPGTPGAGSQGL